ncbi:hydrogenase formation protein HypD [Desulfuribacillus stibiiarsenatis]|uniref:Hydrogenase formation protein HypD n=1 Tax=Desulfuribacillus stibiiarsenatis TaxID=1390249 RepID=A0A1E5L2M3_9FIRM|nr:hydrogenase formation protein HypD [Desulfuribacillus stibiiarsenatis]OEH84368.1 hydrogenase formation protein HypD [Desulfuribacillus stibiiarsenatis]
MSKNKATNVYRDPVLGKELIEAILRQADIFQEKFGRKANLMEVCGTHTVSVSKAGLREVFRDKIELISGPGCPVCVTSHEDIDYMIELGKQQNVILCTFGDMMRVPGSDSSLAEEKANGHDIRVLYSPLEALDIAEENLDKKVIFLAVGFETTTPAIAATIDMAEQRGIENYYVFTAHKICPPVVKLLFQDPNLKVDGLLLPGHVAAIVGRKALDFIATEYHVPSSIAGFEPLDVLAGMFDILRMLNKGEAAVTNQYLRVVKEEGNIPAQEMLEKYFQATDSNWRGIGNIPGSGLELRDPYKKYDARTLFDIKVSATVKTKGCRCGEVLSGYIKPTECGHFGKSCTPVSPVGPCMVSYEGTCATYYKYERKV